jgi:hypothetical protein
MLGLLVQILPDAQNRLAPHLQRRKRPTLYRPVEYPDSCIPIASDEQMQKKTPNPSTLVKLATQAPISMRRTRSSRSLPRKINRSGPL